jgi:hypothetical protein
LLLVSKWLYESRPAARPQPAFQPVTAEPAAPVAEPASAEPKTENVRTAFRLGSESGDEVRALVASSPRTQIRLVAYDEAELRLDELFSDDKISLEDKPAAAGHPSDLPAEHPANLPADHPTNLPTDGSPSGQNGDETALTESELSPELIALRTRLRECLAWYYFRPENVAVRSPWGAMHAMIAYGVDSQLIAGDQRVNAIGYLNYNGVCNGQSLFYTSGNKIHAQIGVGVQGHAGQYLAMLAQSRVKKDFPIRVNGQDFTVADLIQHEKDTCRPQSELTFKLIALSHYLKSDEKWKSDDGQDWGIQRLIQEELKQTIHGAACGGTHRLTGFSYAVRKREQRKEPIEGQWKRAKKYIEDYHEYTFKLQNPDGSMSTEWFVTRADFGDHARRLQTTGHITEWLAFSLRKDQLTEPRMVKTVSYLTNLLLDQRHEKWSIGPLGHGLHALAIYDERVFGGKPGERGAQLAQIRKELMSR